MTETHGPSGDATADYAYCLDLVRRNDRGRYLTTLFAPAGPRPALVALYAFNHEVAKTCHVVSDPMLGQIRLQWWREGLDGIYAGAPRRHAVIQPLAEAIHRYALPRAPLDALIDGHERDLDTTPFADRQALATYCATVDGALLSLAMTITGGPLDENRIAQAREIAVAAGMVRLLRRMALGRAVGPLAVSADIAAEAGLSVEAVRTVSPDDPRLGACVSVAAATAAERLRAARALCAGAQPVDRAVLLHLTLAGHGLKRLNKARYDTYDSRVVDETPGEVWRLLLASITRRY